VDEKEAACVKETFREKHRQTPGVTWKETSTSHSSQLRGGRSPHHDLHANTSIPFSQNLSQIIRFGVKDIDARVGLSYYCSAIS